VVIGWLVAEVVRTLTDRVGATETRHDQLLKWLAYGALFCAPLSKPGANVFIVATCLAVFFVANFRSRLFQVLRSPLAIACGLMCLAYVLSALHHPDLRTAHNLWGYRLFVLLPLVQIALPKDVDRVRALIAFVAGCLVLLVCSVLVGAGVAPKVTSALGQFAFSKNYLQQGLAYISAGCIVAVLSFRSRDERKRWLGGYLAASLLAATVLLLEARTLWPVLAIALCVAAGSAWGLRKGAPIALSALVACVAVAWFSPLSESRWANTETDARAIIERDTQTSWGARAELIRLALPVIAAAPILGHGMGSWNTQMRAVAAQPMSPHLASLDNPHQEILYLAAEQGALGVAAYVAFVILLIRMIMRFTGAARTIFLVVVAVYVSAGLFNAVLADFTHRTVFLLLLTCVPTNLVSYRCENERG
jgi:O-antigen ligase